MTKGDLVSAVAKAANVSGVQAKAAVDATFNEITKSLKKGNDVVLVGFGTFSRVRRKARSGRNPKTGEVIKIKAQNTPRFKAGKSLKDAVK